jgi:nucleotide-binding universal stress UspA family protein
MPEIRRIVCPVDFSEASEYALDYASDFASRLGARIDLVHVYQLPTYALPDGAVFTGADFENKLTGELQKQLDEITERTRKRGLETESQLLRGVPHKEIVRFAQDQEADLVVMGTHGRAGIEHILLGSVAERVVRTSPIPVVTVRQPGQ